MRRKALHIFIILTISLIAYSNTFDVPFLFDDHANITENPLIKNLKNFSLSGYKGYLPRYMTFLTFALNYRCGGLNVVGYHIVNLAVHIANAMLVYFLVILTFRTPYFSRQYVADSMQNKIALFTALLFVSHPIQTQAVSYIVQRLTSLATMFYLLCLVTYIEGRLTKSDSGGLRPAILYLASFVSAVAAMLTKEMAFTLPAVIVLYEFLFFESSLKKRLFFLIPLLLTIIIIPLSIMDIDKPLGDILSDLSEKTRVQSRLSRWEYLFTEIRVVTTYIRLLFLPVNQNLDYDYKIYSSFFTLPVVLSFMFLLFLFGIALYLIYLSGRVEKRQTNGWYRVVGFAILWFFLTLSVESSIIPIADVIFEHRVYLPSVGFFMAICTWATLLMERYQGRHGRVMEVSLLVIIVITLSGLTYVRNGVWGDELRFWEDVARGSPHKARVQYNLGVANDNKGLYGEAIRRYRMAVMLKPDFAKAHYNLGLDYYNTSHPEKAIEHYQITLRIEPDYMEAYNNLGVTYGSLGDMNTAIEYFKKALKLKPDSEEVKRNLSLAYRKLGRGN